MLYGFSLTVAFLWNIQFPLTTNSFVINVYGKLNLCHHQIGNSVESTRRWDNVNHLHNTDKSSFYTVNIQRQEKQLVSSIRAVSLNDEVSDTTIHRTNSNGIILSDDFIKNVQRLVKIASGAALCLLLQASPTFNVILPAHQQNAVASSYYGTLSEEQKVVAEAWRLIDNSFLDRTFNGLDWFQIRQTYVKANKYNSPTDAQAAIAEMTDRLGDKYTRYLSPAKYQSIVNSATGTVAGTGIEISVNKQTGLLYASDVVENSPAFKAGIRPGDVFVEVDGTRFIDDKSATPDDVGAKLRGPKGSRVGVVMQRTTDGEQKELIDVILLREPITITAVKSYMSTFPSLGNVGVIRIKSFSGTTAQTVAEQLTELQKKGAKAYIIDLRNNPGGLLPGGVDTASLFLDKDAPIVFVVNKVGTVDSQTTLGTGIDIESPLVLLVDSNTASAAEVFTAALKENSRAVVVGETTFGKGIVQTVRDLDNGSYGGLAITVARYETPQHHNINLQGIPVDVTAPVTCPKDDAIACLADLSPSTIFRKPTTLVSSSS